VPRRPGRLRLIAFGAALAYFFDPQNGNDRRKGVVKRLAELRSRARPEPLPTADDALTRQVETTAKRSKAS
jgi:hypothetical protein